MTEIDLVDIPPTKVAGTTVTGTYALIPELIMKVFLFLQDRKAVIAGPPLFLCHETSPEAVRAAQVNGTAQVEVAWPVTGRIRGSGDIRVYTLPGGRMAHAIHTGPYDTCESTYLALFAWLEERNLTITGPIRETYPNDPRTVRPEELITGIFVPVG